MAFIAKYRWAAAVALALLLAVLGFLLAQTLQPAKPSSAIEAVLHHLNEAPTPEALHIPEAVPVPEHERTALPRIAIVIDDVGMVDETTKQSIALPAPVTLSFFPYASGVQSKVNEAKAAGHEVFMHVPMEALGGEEPGPDTLRVDTNERELREVIARNLNSFTGYAGINNHMGSKFTADDSGMRFVMEEVKARGLIFLDSRTNPATKGEGIAREMGVKTIRRHIFLDNVLTEENVANQFAELLKLADAQNMAVAIGHPHHVTLEVLAKILPYLRSRYELVPVSALAK